jgi:hypothetical protein
MGGIYFAVSLYVMWRIIRWCKISEGRSQTVGIFTIKPSAKLQGKEPEK